jgi:transcriptional regulator with GAF, ATPase, and Fis domain
MEKKIEAIPPAVMKGLLEWHWPGNIRELENFTERAVILTRGKSLDAPLAELWRRTIDDPEQTTIHSDAEEIGHIVTETLRSLNRKKKVSGQDVRKQHEEIERALAESKGRVGGEDGAAARIGVNRTTLISRMKRLGIDPRQYA